MNLYICITVLVLICKVNGIHFKDCFHNLVSKLEASNCPGETCIIHKGKNFTMSLDFVSNQDTRQLEIQIDSKADGIEIPVPGVESDGCNHVQCPLVKGQKHHFSYNFIVARFMPAVKANVTARLVGDYGEVACINFTVQVQD